ncbi:sensor histidine kinase [Maricaulis sp.]|uniref:sensor histidine kinase n=1 Tax=Maricaulis sp. TaxID=1486257 RepID=UPI002B26D59D|nr:sensor histidine kinase [Maricaulis sp.]
MISLRELTSPNRPWIHLLYLGMFFFGWFYAPPGPVEAAVSLVAMAGFIAVYILAMRRLDWTIYPAALAAAGLGLALLPHSPGGGVYLVFAAAMLGRLPFSLPVWLALAAVTGSGVVAMVMFAPTPLMALGFAGLTAMAAGGSAIAARNERQAEQADRTQARAAHAAAEAERQRIARDLHDLLGHTLSVVTLKAEIAERLLEQDRDRARAELQAIQVISRDALAEVREAVIGLRGRSLADALADAVQRLRDAGVTARMTGADEAAALSPDASTALAMAVREAVTNILRHAEARSVSLAFRRDGASACLDIVDDGVGGADPAGGGLSGLDARLAALDGTLRVGTGPFGSGTCLTASLPWPGGRHD